MSEVKKLEEGQEVLGTVDIDTENVSWDTLHETHRDIAKEVIDLQLMVGNMATANQVLIDADPEIFKVVKGLMETIKDTSEEIMQIQASYIKGRPNLVGFIPKDDVDDIMLYVATANAYVAAGEKLAMLSSTAVTDILTMLNINPAELVNEINQEEGTKDESR